LAYSAIVRDHAYFICLAIFADTPDDESVVYRSVGTVVLKEMRHPRAFTGSLWAWGANSLLAKIQRRAGTGGLL
jgi:hypothetical protein